MAKKNYRGNNTYLIEGNTGDNPKLMGQSLSDGRDSWKTQARMTPAANVDLPPENNLILTP